MKFANKAVVITGAFSGLGRQAAERAILVSPSEPKLLQLTDEIAGMSPS